MRTYMDAFYIFILDQNMEECVQFRILLYNKHYKLFIDKIYPAFLCCNDSLCQILYCLMHLMLNYEHQ